MSRGPCFSSYGPHAGPAMNRDGPPSIGVYLEAGGSHSVGSANPVGWVAHWRGSVATFRLTIGKESLPGLWVVVGRRFFPVDEWPAGQDEPAD